MATFTIKTTGLDKLRTKLTNGFKKTTDKATADKIGKATVKQIKARVESGKHTIAGKPTNFEAYRGGYREKIRKSGRVNGFRKSLRPVNLKLSGDFLNSLKFELITRVTKYTVKVGFFDSENKTIEKGHREGANGQAERPIIPQGNETFKRPIIQEIEKIITDRVNKIVSKI